MKNDFIPQMKPFFSIEEKNSLMEYMDEDGFLTEFKRTEEFENLIAEYTGAKHCIVVNNGTVSLTLAALAAGIKANDEVLVPNYTMVATPNSISMIGAKPVFVDVEPNSLCIDLKDAKNKLTKKTKAIFLVSANGRFPEYEISELISFTKENNLVLLEDAAQSLGSFFPDGQHIGTKGLIGSFSFSAPKIISTGQGGALVTNDDDLAQKLRKLKDFGRSSGGNDIHDSIGFNFKFTELQACVGLEQMKKLPSRVERKKEIWLKYKEQLKEEKNIHLFDHNLSFTAPWFIDSMVENRQELMNYLLEENIGSRIMYPPLNSQKAYSLKGNFPVSELIGKKGLWLPSFVQIDDSQIEYICKKIKEFYKN